MAPDIPLDRQRPAEYVFSRHVEQKLAEIREAEAARRAGQWQRNSPAMARAVSAASRSERGELSGVAGRARRAAAAISTPPSLRMAASAAGGMSRVAGSATTRSTAKGSPWRVASCATTWLSMSAATAPVAACSARFSASDVSGRSTPAMVDGLGRADGLGDAGGPVRIGGIGRAVMHDLACRRDRSPASSLAPDPRQCRS